MSLAMETIKPNVQHFNGATARKLWMRPFGEDSAAYPAGYFNGATARKLWMSIRWRGSGDLWSQLQWGHSSEAVDEPKPLAR